MERHGERYAALIVIGLTPVFWWASGAATLMQFGMVDPYIYTGFANLYGYVLERWPDTYYPTRVSSIFPEFFFSKIAGAGAGYLIWHGVVASTIASCTWLIARRFYGNAVALLSVGFLAISPWLPRSLILDYVTAPGVAYVLAGLSLLVLPAWPHWYWLSAAGGLFFLAVNANPVFLAIAVPLVAAWLLTWSTFGGLRDRALALGSLVGGVAAAFVALGALIAWQYPVLGFWFELRGLRWVRTVVEANIAQARASTGPNWDRPHWSIFWDEPSLIIEASILLAGVILAAMSLRASTPRSAPLVRLAGLFALSTALFFVFNQGVLKGAALNFFFYRIVALPAVVLCLIVLLGELLGRSPRVHRWVFSVVVIALFALTLVLRLIAGDSWIVYVFPPAAILALGAVCVISALLTRYGKPVPAILVAAVALGLVPVAWRAPEYPASVFIGERNALEWEVHKAAVAFQDRVAHQVPPNESVVFWYRAAPLLTSIQSTFLWSYSLAALPGEPELPTVDEPVLDRVRSASYVSLLGTDSRRLAAGIEAMCENDISLSPVDSGTFREDDVEFRFALFRTGQSQPCINSDVVQALWRLDASGG